MKLSKFKVGDRCIGECFNTDLYQFQEVVGAYTDSSGGPRIEGYAVAPRSIRRLIKKPRRRIWINEKYFNTINGLDSACVFECKPELAPGNYIEFVEVRKKVKP
jgi:hypothetical protein